MRKVLILLLYRILPAAAFPLLLLYVLWRCVRDPRYFRRLSERFGFLPAQYQRTVPDSVWLHAVSVGEVLSSVQLIRKLREELPESPIFISCTTLAGREVADSKLKDLVDGVFYAPIDYVGPVRHVLRRIRPAVVVVLETEIWPNLYREAKRAGCGLVVVNGRISPKALPRYRRLAWFFRTVLAEPDAILVQSPDDRDRYIAAGAPPERVHSSGNLKYDFDPRMAEPPPAVLSWLGAGRGPLWIAASTVAPEYAGDVDEDDAVIAAFAELRPLFPALRLLIAPRKPERFDVVAAKLQAAGVPFVRRSGEDGAAPVLLLDSLGELGSIFPFADIVFMGGTVADRGGHNILEPASSGRPVIVGPHLENFAQIQRDFRRANAFIEIADAAGLAPAVEKLLRDSCMRAEFGQRAHETADSERGATIRAVHAIVDAREAAIPRAVNYGPLKPFLWMLSRLWIAGGRLKRRVATPKRLPAPVISVGGLALGGVGKTPLVRHLVSELADSGADVAVLTRGYKRRSRERVSVIERGQPAGVDVTGDEAQLILRDGRAHLGVSADRHAAGLLLHERFGPSAYVLDDGFQHAALHRDLDIVLLDGVDPFAGSFVFPLGWLREPPSALVRAGAIVITRASARRAEGLRPALRAINAEAPILYSTVEPLEWVDIATGERLPLDSFAGRPVAAFCGLASPESFRRTVRALGCETVYFHRFADHHSYSAREMQYLAATAGALGATALLTTEKDAVKLAKLGSFGARVCSLSIMTRLAGDAAPELLRSLQMIAKVTNP